MIQVESHDAHESIMAESVAKRGFAGGASQSERSDSNTIPTLLAEISELRARLAAVDSERKSLLDRQREVMALLSCTSSDHLLHDLRNLLNERTLYRTLADLVDSQQKPQ